MAVSDSFSSIYVVKIGGAVIDDEARLKHFLAAFAGLKAPKILVHGGGKLATQLADKLGIPTQMVDGRRVTDLESLRIVTMVYGGLINKQLVARLQAIGCPSIGVCGADGDLVRAHKRRHPHIDFGWVGDVDAVNDGLLKRWVEDGLTPVIAPLSHDGQGNILNTNADTIAFETAQALSRRFEVELIFGFEKSGVLLDVNDETSRLPELRYDQYVQLKSEGIITAGMIPKLDNAFKAVRQGVKRVVIGPAEQIEALLGGQTGTNLKI